MSKPRFFMDRTPSTLPSFQRKTNFRLFLIFFLLNHYQNDSFSFVPKFLGTNLFVSLRSWKVLEHFCLLLFDLNSFKTNPFVSLRSWKALEYLCLFVFDPNFFRNKTVCSSSFLKSLGIHLFVPLCSNFFLFLFSSILNIFVISWFVSLRSSKALS